MPATISLTLPEEILLLALRDEEGTIAMGSMYQYAMGGAAAAELLMRGRIAVEQTKKMLVNVIDERPTGDAVLDECLEKIRTAKRRAVLSRWVGRFGNLGKLKHRVAARLCERGILRADQDKVLLIFTRKIYPEVDPKPERALIERLRKAIFKDSASVDPRTVVLVSLAAASGLLRNVFDKRELKKRKARIEQIVNGEVTGKAAKQAIQAMQAAVMVAGIMPGIIASTTATHH